MNRDERALFDGALARATRAGYPRGEFVGQESFMRASEIRFLAQGRRLTKVRDSN